MPRPIAQPYNCPPLAELARQLLYAPPDKRMEQVRRTERLHDTLDPRQAYPFDFLNYRITGYRSESRDQTLLYGEAVLHDLRLMIDMLSKSAPLPADGDEAIESVEDLAARLNVSTKTVARWRKAGLRWRWVLTPPPAGDETGEGRKWLGIPRSAIERFLTDNKDRVERATRFSQIEPAVRQQIVDRARRIAQTREVSLNQVAVHLARKYDRSLEAIRQLLMQHDQEHAADPIFADYTGPLDAEQKRVIARAYRMGVTVSKIARHFRRTRSTIYRAVHERRAGELRKLKIEYQTWSTFERTDADQVILRPEQTEPPVEMPSAELADVRVDDLPPALRPLYRQPRMEAGRERSLIVRYNYLKYKAARLRDALDRYEPRAADMDFIEQWIKDARQIRDRLVAANLGLVLNVARRHLTDDPTMSAARLIELLELGNVVLIEAIDRFDGARAQSFEAFLTWSLMRDFAVNELDRSRHKAHAKVDGLTVLKRMQDTAGESGVELKLEPEEK